jgi:hypothetical protein
MDYTLKQKTKGKSDTGIFDQMDKLPDMSLRELYYVLKASRRKIKEKIINGAETGFKMV